MQLQYGKHTAKNENLQSKAKHEAEGTSALQAKLGSRAFPWVCRVQMSWVSVAGARERGGDAVESWKETSRRRGIRAREAAMASPNNIADQIVNAVQNAVNSQDFTNLQSTIERSIGSAAESIGRGIAQASDGIRRGQEQYAQIQQRKRHEEQLNALYAKPTSQRGAGVALVTGGVMVAVPALATGIALAAIGVSAGFAVLAIGAAASAGLIFAGSRKAQLARSFERYRNAIDVRESFSLDQLAATVSETPDRVRKNVRALLACGMFKQGALDDDETTLYLTTDAYQRYLQTRAESLHQQNLIEAARAAEAAKTASLTPEQRRLLERGEAFIDQIRAGNQAIPGAEISRTIDQIERVVRAILDCAAEDPRVIDDLDHLMDYYLPTTVKLLDAYQDLDAQPIQSESIVQSKREIEGALASLSTGFEKLLDSLFRDRTLDVSADISVLHTVLAQEGLVASPFDNADATTRNPANH